RRLVIEPNAPPLLACLAHVLGLVQQRVRALVRVARVLVEQASGVGKPDRRQAREKKQTPHVRPPCRWWTPVPRGGRPRVPPPAAARRSALRAKGNVAAVPDGAGRVIHRPARTET